MIGTWRWNVTIALLGALLTFGLSLSGNIIATTLLRTVYTFVLLFVVGFLFRWVLGTIVGFSSDGGSTIDLSTPEEVETMQQLLKNDVQLGHDNDDQGFSPMNPPKLVSNNASDPEKVAQVIRHMVEDEGR